LPQAPKRITNADLAARLEALEEKLEKRLDHLEGSIGLNGDGNTLKDFLEELRASNVNHLAWGTVRADLKSRFRFLAEPKKLLGIFIAALIGGAGWAVVNHLLVIWPTR
jgi:hypothetical protein